MSDHLKQQAYRFGRLFVVALLATGVLSSGSYGRDAIVSAVVGALEVAWRQFAPVAPAPAPVVAPPAPPAA